MQIGYYKLVLPVKYLENSASEDDKKTFEFYKDAFSQMLEGKKKGMVFPAVTDQDGNYLFDLQYVGPDNVTVINNYNVKE